jgi:predicted  nucleic acid-binding Zn-ribbon protein
MSQPFKLFRLQQFDSALDKGRQRQAEIDRLLADDLEIRLVQQKLESAQKDQYTAEKNLRLAEENVKQQRIKIERSQAALYGGKVVNPKELQDLQHESEALKRHLGTLEDQQLEAMLALDEAEAGSQSAEENQAAVERQVAAKKEQLLKERDELEQDMEINESERAAAISSIDEADLAQYEKLRKKKNGIAVARITDKNCAACGSTLTATIFSQAKSPHELTCCNSCGRILYAG